MNVAAAEKQASSIADRVERILFELNERHGKCLRERCWWARRSQEERLAYARQQAGQKQ